jgi:hypothetical protein
MSLECDTDLVSHADVCEKLYRKLQKLVIGNINDVEVHAKFQNVIEMRTKWYTSRSKFAKTIIAENNPKPKKEKKKVDASQTQGGPTPTGPEAA